MTGEEIGQLVAMKAKLRQSRLALMSMHEMACSSPLFAPFREAADEALLGGEHPCGIERVGPTLDEMSNETAADKALCEILEAAGGTVVDVPPYTPSEPGAHCRISADAGLAVMNGTGDNHPRCAACGKAWSEHLGCEPLCAKLKTARAALRLILSDGQSREQQITREALEKIE